MKISLNWISEFVNIDISDPEKLALQVAEHCFEVEKIIRPGDTAANAQSNQSGYAFSNVFVAKVLSFEKHPNADRLRVVKLDLGGKIIDPVVCGAANFVEGDLVALALPGANIPQNVHTGEKELFVLGKAKIRGIESQGMICSAFELALAEVPETAPVILIFGKDGQAGAPKSGTPLEEYLDSQKALENGNGKAKPTKTLTTSKDVVFDLALAANRPDLHSHFGIAREFAGILGVKTSKIFNDLEKKYGTAPKNISAKDKSNSLEIDIQDKEHCKYYLGAKIKVKVGPSPAFIKERLESLGMRSINNVVDITNYVMTEIGQPMHAFDASTVTGNKIVVRNAKAGEQITSLDHKKRVLNTEMLLITDSQKALAIAGVIGGENSEIKDNTAEIILESANFEQFSIRKTSKALGLRTDASGLWEKGLHPHQAILGFNRALELLKEHAAAEVLSIGQAGSATQTKPQVIKFSTEQINSILGTDFKADYIKKMLTRVGVKISAGNAQIPYYRSDMYNYSDLADEVARISGMNNIVRTAPMIVRNSMAQNNQSARIYSLKEQMALLGFTEVQNYSFVSAQEIKMFGQEGVEKHLKVKNPLSADQEYLKLYPLIGNLKNVSQNAKYSDSFKLFEVSKIYLELLNEPDVLSMVIYDKNISAEALLAKVKGVVDQLISKYTTQTLTAKDRAQGILGLYLNNELVGELGLVSAELKLNFDIPSNTAYAQFNLAKIWQAQQPINFKAYSKFPTKVLDISLVVKEGTLWTDILETVQANAGSNLRDVQLFEAPYLYPNGKQPKFHKELVEKGLKNMAFHLVFQAENDTLKDSEILPIYAKIQEQLKSKLGAEIR